MSVIPTVMGLRQEDGRLEASLDHTANSSTTCVTQETLSIKNGSRRAAGVRSSRRATQTEGQVWDWKQASRP